MDGGEAPMPSQRSPTGTTVKGAQRFEGDEDGLESSVAAGGSLKDHLEEQLAIAALPPEKRLVCLSLIDAVDEAGYMRGDLDEIAQRLGTSLACVEEVLKVLQGFDPIGVAARDLAECLRIQLKAKDPARSRHGGAAHRGSIWWRGARRRRCARSAASTPKTLPTWSRRSAA